MGSGSIGAIFTFVLKDVADSTISPIFVFHLSCCDVLFATLIGAELRHLNIFGANPILVSRLARAQPSLAIQQAN